MERLLHEDLEWEEVVDPSVLEMFTDKNMSNLKRFAMSSVTTFIATFGLIFCMAIQEPTFTFTSAAIGTLALSASITAVRAVAKLVVELASGYLVKSK